MNKEQEWLLKEKYGGEKYAPVFNDIEEIKNKYPWGEGFFADCARLEAGEPLAYIIGNIPFLDVTISLGSKPLIPRPETEYWVEKAIEAITLRNAEEGRRAVSIQGAEAFIDVPFRILDLCAGSGAIGVAVGKALPMARVDFAEIDASHHSTIVDNICDNGLDYTNTRVFAGDLFAEIPSGTKYDAILSNPPYIDPMVNRAEQSVTSFEPHLALYGGIQGMEIITRLIHTAPNYLAPRGTLWIEHEPEQTAQIGELGAMAGFTTTTHIDQFGIERFSILTAA